MSEWAERAPRFRVTARAVVLGAVVLSLGVATSVPIRQFFEQRAEIDRLEQQVEDLAASRAQLEQRIERMDDPAYLERIARECLGMVRPGEISFIVPDEGPPPVC